MPVPQLFEELNGSQQQLKEAEEKRLAAEQRAEAEAAKAKVPPKAGKKWWVEMAWNGWMFLTCGKYEVVDDFFSDDLFRR